MPRISNIAVVLCLALGSAGALAYYGRSARLEAADGAFSVGAMIGVEANLARAVQDNPYDVEAWSQLGTFYEQSGRLDEALVAFERAGQHSSQDPVHVLRSAALLLRLGRSDEAESRVLMILQSRPELAAAHRTLGWISLRRADSGVAGLEGPQRFPEHYRAADRNFERALRITPLDAEAMIGRALVARYEDRPADALRFLQQVVLIDSASYWGWQGLGEIYSGMGLDPEAQAAFERAESLAEGRPYSLAEMADLARRQNRRAAAAELMGRIGAEASFGRGMDLESAGADSAAERAFLEAMLTDPEDLIALDRLEQVRIRLFPAGDTRRAELASRRLIGGEQAASVKNSLLAYLHYRRAVQLAPQSSEARLRMAKFLDREGAYTEAIRQLQRVEELTRSQHERLVASDMMEVITRQALMEMEKIHGVDFGDAWDQPTSALGEMIGNSEMLEERIRWSVTPVPRPRVRIAILKFVEPIRPAHLEIGRIAADQVSFTLGLLPGFEMVPQSEIDRAVARRNLSSVDQADPGQIGADLRADFVVQGKVVEAREDVRIEVTVYRVPAGPVVLKRVIALAGSDAFGRAALEIARSLAERIPPQGAVIRRRTASALTINLGRIHGLREGDTIEVIRRNRELYVPGLDWVGMREESVAMGRITGLTERYGEVQIIEEGARLRAGDIVRRRL